MKIDTCFDLRPARHEFFERCCGRKPQARAACARCAVTGAIAGCGTTADVCFAAIVRDRTPASGFGEGRRISRPRLPDGNVPSPASAARSSRLHIARPRWSSSPAQPPLLAAATALRLLHGSVLAVFGSGTADSPHVDGQQRIEMPRLLRNPGEPPRFIAGTEIDIAALRTFDSRADILRNHQTAKNA